MKRTINGTTYDTDHDEIIKRNDFSGETADPLFDATETLYRTAEGHWYVYGEGGAGTIYCREDELGGTVGADDIITLDDEQAEYYIEHIGTEVPLFGPRNAYEVAAYI